MDERIDILYRDANGDIIIFRRIYYGSKMYKENELISKGDPRSELLVCKLLKSETIPLSEEILKHILKTNNAKTEP